MSAERDLAEAIYAEITQPERVNDALLVWRNPQSRSWTEFDRMAFVLCRISAAAIDTVLARRQREAARDPSRWDERDEIERCIAKITRHARLDSTGDETKAAMHIVVNWLQREAARTGPWDATSPTRGEAISALRERVAHLEIYRGRGPINARLHELECMRAALCELEARSGPWGET